MTKITIGLTCYNAGDTIGRAIESALKQDWDDVEIIVVDDVSSDNSVDVIKQYDVQLVQHKTNLGVGGARATILSQAKGQYIAFFDDDDVSDPQRIKLQFEAIQHYKTQHKNVPVLCFASGQRLYDNGYSYPLYAVGSRKLVPVGEEMIDYLLFFKRKNNVFYGSGTPACGMMAARDDLVFDTRLRRGEDIDCAIQAGLNGAHFIGIQDKVLTQQATGGADKNPQAEYESYLAIIEKYKDYLQSKGRYFYAKQWLLMKYHYYSKKKCRAVLDLVLLLMRHPVWAGAHFLYSAPRRIKHEKSMQQ